MSESNPIFYTGLYQLHDPLANRPFRLDPIDEDWIHKLDACALFQGKFQPVKPVTLKAAMGGQATDFLWSRLPPLVCVSERVIALLNKYKFSGWSTYPVKVYDRKNNYLDGYYGFAVTSSVGEDKKDIDISRSQIVTKPPIVPGGKSYMVYKGLYFDESKWDGSDIFRLIGYIIVTSQVREMFKKEKITNVRFDSLIDHESDVSDFKTTKVETGQ